MANERGPSAGGNTLNSGIGSAAGKGSTAPSVLIEPPSINVPKGGGAIHGIGEKFAANPVTGTGSMTVPIAVSPGRSGFGPQLSLSYDSGSGNGPFGFGWSLSLPEITRKTDKGLPQYRDADESDVFILSGAEDLVPLLADNGERHRDTVTAPGFTIRRYRPRIEGLFARIERWTNDATGETHWRSTTRDNITTLFGVDAESRIADPADASHVFTWLICRSYDDKGNATVYRYAAEDGQNVGVTQMNERNRVRSANRYPKRILYGNRVSRLVNGDLDAADWLFEVVFDYDEGHYAQLPLDANKPEAAQHRFVHATATAASPWTARPDPFSSYRSGFEVRTYRRCRRVLMFHRFPELGAEPYLVRSTQFDYADFDSTRAHTVDDELAVQGSTRFASFISAVTQSGYVRADDDQTYLEKSFPPVEFEYSKAVIDEDVHELEADSVDNLPAGLADPYQWVDLDGEGISGILTEQGGAWLYKRNLGDGEFAPVETLVTIPSFDLAGGRGRLVDLAGDGRVDLATFGAPTPGFFERTDDGDWLALRVFARLPNVAWNDPNLRFVDLDGDGRSDVLVTEDEVFTWYPSMGEEGFGDGRRLRQSDDEEHGPRLVIADGTQSIYIADMSGDGLADLVRIRNGEVCYWPNIGYGRFGAKVAMDNPPWFASREEFDEDHVRLADIDGSGATDIIYLSPAGPVLYFNQSGNRWSDPRALSTFPKLDSVVAVATADLLGNGTACIVWSSPLPDAAERRIRYIDLMSGTKPHLLTRSRNNLGAETIIQYAPSTKFYLADRREGHPWVTRIPFPVHVVERVETRDHVSRNRFVTRNAYHHGYFDGDEREFRGFGLVEQWDTEVFAALTEDGEFPASNIEEYSHVPPVLTKTWYHTGVYLGRDRVSDYHAAEYYREPELTDQQARDLLLDDTILPDGLSVEEEAEACRALKGSMLRQEIYGRDGSDQEDRPYVVTEQNFAVRALQRRGPNRHAVFFTHARESIAYQYERAVVPVLHGQIVDDATAAAAADTRWLADPRVAHTLTLEVDDYGNVLKSATIAYGRRHADSRLPEQADRDRQMKTWVVYTENKVTNTIETNTDYRLALPAEACTYELTGYAPTGLSGRYQASDLVDRDPNDPERVIHLFDSQIDYEESPGATRQRRLIKQVRTLFRKNDLSGALPLGSLESLALPAEAYNLALTPGLLAGFVRTSGGLPPEDLLPDPAVVLGGIGGDGGGYVRSQDLKADGLFPNTDANDRWFVPSGRVFYSANAADVPADERSHALDHFFIPRRFRNAFGETTAVAYDVHDVLRVDVTDPVGNRVTVGERLPNGDVDATRPGLDYRVLLPWRVMDANRNRAQVLFDALGMVTATAVLGKPEENVGDSIAGIDPDPTDDVVLDYLTNPVAQAGAILGTSTTRILYDLFAYRRTSSAAHPGPSVVYTATRETHQSDLQAGETSRVEHTFAYSDGFSREIQRKMQAERGPVPARDGNGAIVIGADGQPQMTPGDADPRWVGSGWRVFNNKGKPIREYEPYFTDTHRFEFDLRIGVSPIVFHDAVERVVLMLLPNHSWEKTLFGPWLQEVWSVADTLAVDDPKTDDDVGAYFIRLPDADYLPTWFGARDGGALGPQEQSAARKATVHSSTPAKLHGDALGRAFLSIAHNRFAYSDALAGAPPVDEQYLTRVLLDVEGQQREIHDANDRLVVHFDYDMMGVQIHHASMEGGEHWVLNDAAGKQLYAWDTRQHQVRNTYDAARRPSESFLKTGAGAELLVVRTVHGETQPDPELRNVRGKVVELSDQAGVVTTDEYDFKGNIHKSGRRLARSYDNVVDWSAAVPLEAGTYSTITRYDAGNRPVGITAPDNSVIRIVYNEGGLLAVLDVDLRGELDGAGQPLWTNFIADVDYNAHGQRTRIEYGNGVATNYTYDPFTTRLTGLVTARSQAKFPDDCADPPAVAWPGCQVQNIQYTYDPSGNITHLIDTAQQRVYFDNVRVDASQEFTYDALHRVIEATGREHLGQIGGPPLPNSYNDVPRTSVPHPGDGNAMARYLERYSYDSIGNLLSMQHRGSNPVNPGWTRTFEYLEASFLEPVRHSNRLTSTACGGEVDTYSNAGDGYDTQGNMLRMPQLNAITWDFRDQIQMTRRQAVNADDASGMAHDGERTWYVYDSTGMRVRKVTESSPGQLKEERIYLSGFEVYRRNGIDPLVRETLHVMDDVRRVALVETRTAGAEAGVPARLVRYQIGNHLGSAAIELDAAAAIISYEEYTPYGSTSYQAVRSQTETPKRYRYSGKERDEESGLNYHGARYYAPWIGRWASCDPLLTTDSPNLYVYARCNPVVLTDGSGTQPNPTPLSEHDVIYGILTHPRPGDAASWWAQGPRAHPADWAGGLSAWEQRYIDTFRSSSVAPILRMREPVDPNHLTAEDTAAAQRIFGNGPNAARQYANYETRRRILAHYVYTHPATVRLELGLFRLFRDVNPIHFAFERGWQVGSGHEMFTGEQVSRLGAAAEFFTALAIGYALGRALEIARPPIGTPLAGQTLADLQNEVLREAIRARASAISTQGNPAYLTNATRGPVLTGVMDRTTGEVFFGMNEGIPPDLHPLLQQRLNELLRSAGGQTPVRAGVPGAHSEINALNRALRAMEARLGRAATEADLGNFSYHNRALQGANRAVGVPPPCANCTPLMEGTNFVQ